MLPFKASRLGSLKPAVVECQTKLVLATYFVRKKNHHEQLSANN